MYMKKYKNICQGYVKYTNVCHVMSTSQNIPKGGDLWAILATPVVQRLHYLDFICINMYIYNICSIYLDWDLTYQWLITSLRLGALGGPGRTDSLQFPGARQLFWGTWCWTLLKTLVQNVSEVVFFVLEEALIFFFLSGFFKTWNCSTIFHRIVALRRQTKLKSFLYICGQMDLHRDGTTGTGTSLSIEAIWTTESLCLMKLAEGAKMLPSRNRRQDMLFEREKLGSTPCQALHGSWWFGTDNANGRHTPPGTKAQFGKSFEVNYAEKGHLSKDEQGNKLEQLQAILSRVVVLSSFAFKSCVLQPLPF